MVKKIEVAIKKYIIMALIISCFTSIASSVLYNRWIKLEKNTQEFLKKNEELIKNSENLKRREKTLNDIHSEIDRQEEILKNKEEELNRIERELKDKETTLKEREDELINRENKLKEREQAVENKFVATKPKPPNSVVGDKVAYLTFDDGPSANTEKILDILATNDVRATFFVNGYNGFDSTYLRIVNEGHKIANHTYSHNYSDIYSSVDRFYNSVNELDNKLESLGISKTDIMRFPGGSNNQVSYKYGGYDFMDKLVSSIIASGYDYFDWNVDSGDADAVTNDKNTIVNNVITGCANKNTPVILFHDSAPKTTTAEGLQEIIDYLRGQGYSFGVLENGTGLPVKFK